MNLLHKLLLILFLIPAAALNDAYSQKLSSPIDPGELPQPVEYGLILGIGDNFQTGSFLVDCPDCVFEDGAAFGYSVGASYENYLFHPLRYGIMGLYQQKGIEASYVERELVPIRALETDNTYNIPVNFRHEAATNIAYLSAIPYIDLTIWNTLFFRLGFSMSYVLNANLEHSKILTDRYASVGNIDSVRIELESGGYQQMVQDSHFDDVNKLQFSLMPMAGFQFSPADHVLISPLFAYTLPFTNLSENGEDFKIHSWRIMIEVKYVFMSD